MKPFSQLSPVLAERAKKLKLVVFDFDGVFTDNMVYVIQGGTEAVRCSRSDGIGLRHLEKVGVEPVVVSTETNVVVAERCNKLSIRCFHGCDDKLRIVRDLVSALSISLQEVGYLGNDVNDSECLRHVGFPMIVNDAHPDVLELGVYRTNTAGGYGAVREVCDLIAHYKSR